MRCPAIEGIETEVELSLAILDPFSRMRCPAIEGIETCSAGFRRASVPQTVECVAPLLRGLKQAALSIASSSARPTSNALPRY